ncbi:MAG: hypothetical protein V1772_09010 [Chloroflexota bacterium]
MRTRLATTLGTAILSVVLALIVWVNASLQADRPAEGELQVAIPVVVLNAPAGLQPINEYSRNVRVRLRAFDSSWQRLTRDDFTITVDWAGLGEGTHNVPIQVTCDDPTVTVLRANPATQTVILERVKRESREVVIELQGREDVPLGYRVDAPEITPSLISVEGPASLVDRVDHLAVSLSLRNQNRTLESILEPVPVDGDGRAVVGVKLVPAAVTVRVVIEKRQNYREVAVRARTTGQPARGYFVSGVDIVPAIVTLVGPPSVVENMGGLVDVDGEVNIAAATRMVAERHTLDLPDGVSVLGSREGEPFTVLVTVGIDAVTGGTTVELRVQVRKLQEGLVARLSVSALDVILTGPAVVLDALQTNLLAAYLDLSGLPEGVHQIRPQVEVVAGQDSPLRDLVVKDVSPKFIEVTISLPPTPTPTSTPEPTEAPTETPAPTVTPTLRVATVRTAAPAAAATPTPAPAKP